MTRSSIDSVRLVTNATVDASTLMAEFPTLTVECSHLEEASDCVIDARDWRTLRSFGAFDEALDQGRDNVITVRGDGDIGLVACEVLTRFQRLIDRRNGASDTATFTVVVRAHRALHDENKPLVRADLDHALDTWQWMLRLDAKASLSAQLSALFHDVERLEGDSDPQLEHHAEEYLAFKDAHAEIGGERSYDILRAAGFDEKIARRVRTIISLYERRTDDPEIRLLNDADALSFLSLCSSTYLDAFGRDQARRKIVYTLRRLGASARAKLGLIRLRPDVLSLFEEAA